MPNDIGEVVQPLALSWGRMNSPCNELIIYVIKVIKPLPLAFITPRLLRPHLREGSRTHARSDRFVIKFSSRISSFVNKFVVSIKDCQVGVVDPCECEEFLKRKRSGLQ